MLCFKHSTYADKHKAADRQTTSFNDFSIEAGILLRGNGNIKQHIHHDDDLQKTITRTDHDAMILNSTATFDIESLCQLQLHSRRLICNKKLSLSADFQQNPCKNYQS
jgi:hypothetical protein